MVWQMCDVTHKLFLEKRKKQRKRVRKEEKEKSVLFP